MSNTKARMSLEQVIASLDATSRAAFMKALDKLIDTDTYAGWIWDFANMGNTGRMEMARALVTGADSIISTRQAHPFAPPSWFTDMVKRGIVEERR